MSGRAYLRRHAVELSLVAGLVCVNTFARWVMLEPIENGGDPLDAWYFVRQLAHHNDPAHAGLNHHTSRFGMHWITWVVQHLFGTHPHFYYLPQLIASSTCVALVYLLGRQVHGRVAGALAATWLMQLELFHSASCQLRRGIFETMYALAALNCFVRYLDEQDERGQRRWLVACAVLAFLGYLVELPSLYVSAGIGIALLLARRAPRHVLLFAGILLGLFLVETAAYTLFTKYHGRLGVLMSPRGQLGLVESAPEVTTVSELIERFTEARGNTRFIYLTFFLTGPLTVWRGSPKRRAVALAGLTFAFLLTIVVRSLHPVIPFEPNRTRYLLQGVPLAMVTTVALGLDLTRALLTKLQALRPSLATGLGGTLRARLELPLISGLFLLVGCDAYTKRSDPHPIADVDRVYTLINDAFARNLPVTSLLDTPSGPNVKPRARAMSWAVKGFVQDRFLLVDRRLPDFSPTRSIGLLDRYAYLPASMDPERVRELMRERCSVRLYIRGTFVEAVPAGERLPDDCGH
ncbi:MAG TPA: glycosyltransferase family 39 protein [Polyangiaceae bacterium]|nr:glycosyltransferase family 39 protein [Polyangiaceae bacterium]